MDSAFGLFTTQEVSKTSIEDIVKAAGVAKGTFYLYFKDKYDLHQILIQHKFEQLVHHALDCSDYKERQSVGEKILSITDDILTQLQENCRLLQFFNRNMNWSVFKRLVDRTGTEYRLILEEIFGIDFLENTDTQVEIYTILELICSTCHSVIMDREPVDMDTFRPYLHRTIYTIINSFQTLKPVFNNQEVISDV